MEEARLRCFEICYVCGKQFDFSFKLIKSENLDWGKTLITARNLDKVRTVQGVLDKQTS